MIFNSFGLSSDTILANNPSLVFIILLAIVIGFFVATIAILYNKQQNTDKIQSGVYIKGINVSGLTKEDAINLVNENLTTACSSK